LPPFKIQIYLGMKWSNIDILEDEDNIIAGNEDN
jgi:hypothetical protein